MVRTPRRQTFPPTRPTGSYLRREAAIESALKNKLEAKKKAREAAAAAAQREIAEFTAHFMEAAQRCFELIDKDDSGTLTKEEIVVAVKSDKVRTRRPTTARTSTCEDSVICGTAVFVCLVCGGAESDYSSMEWYNVAQRSMDLYF